MACTGRGRGQDSLIGKTVVVCAGPDKGRLGTVVDLHDKTARVELQAKMKRISLDVAQLRVAGETYVVVGRSGRLAWCCGHTERCD